MRQVAIFIRSVAVLAGLFLAGSAMADMAGFIPHSQQMPSLDARVANSLPPFLFGVVLLLPHRWFLASRRFHVLLGAHVLVAGVAGYRTVETFLLVRAGQLDPVALLVAAVAVAIPLLNAAALWFRWRSGRLSSHSFETNPLRGPV